jgi:hypothetical protein
MPGMSGLSAGSALATRLHGNLIDEAPQPVLTRFERLHDRVRGGVEVLGRVLVLRGIATTDVAANAAEPQMDPGIANLQALFAPLRRPWRNVANLVEVGTRGAHWVSFPGHFRSKPSGPDSAFDSGTQVET